MVIGDDRRKGPCPRAAVRRERRPVDLEAASVNAAAAFGHRPVREPLVEVSRQEPDERGMHPRVGVDAADGMQPVPVPHEMFLRRSGRLAGAGRCADAGAPQPLHRAPLVPRTIVGVTHGRQRRTGLRRKIGAESRQHVSLFEDPRELPPGRVRNAVQHHGAPEVEPRAGSRDILARGVPQFLAQQRVDVAGADAAGGELVAIARLGEERLASQLDGGTLDRLLERQVLERMQRVVMNEDADGALRGEQVRELVEDARERMARGLGGRRTRDVGHRRDL